MTDIILNFLGRAPSEDGEPTTKGDTFADPAGGTETFET